ncbi:hypothetical protein N7519_000460 [Penicillium mononematosum]|uniref:uncharacterized protein n=1 Tax=Penicillium mononematosum TaxID=268346 RepID=UPI0025486306|nr:uncharacterized protein N7519_000460 [Penicillium mononematosum]KAJ6190439.1 hypothetical protein N7519_000460 [Penicillium mononematosum]
MADSIRSGLSNIHTALDNLVKNPRRLDSDRSRFDRDVSYISHQSHNSTASMSPESPTMRQQRERQERRDLQKWELIKAHDASRPNQQFDAQDVPDGTNMNNLAYETVKNNWIEQGIWNDEWVNMPSEQWMHELSPEITPEPETYPGGRTHIGLFASLESALPTDTGKNVQQGGERQPKQKTGDEPSRPFHQFIYQISKERERVRNLYARPSLFDDSEPAAFANINSNAYERVKSIWAKRGIWNEEWGILPGMAWKHESPLQIPDNDCDSMPSPMKPKAHVTFNLFQDLFPAQADGPAPKGGQGTRKRKRAAAPQDLLPAQADGPAPVGGQGTSKRKRAAAPVETKRTKRKVSKTVKPEASSSRRAVDNSTNQVDVPDQGTQDTGRRRSKRIQNQTKSSN